MVDFSLKQRNLPLPDRSQKAKEKTAARAGPVLIQNGQVDLSTFPPLDDPAVGMLNKEVTVYSHLLDNAIQLSSHSQVDVHL